MAEKDKIYWPNNLQSSLLLSVVTHRYKTFFGVNDAAAKIS
jgi:hypothetical protein